MFTLILVSCLLLKVCSGFELEQLFGQSKNNADYGESISSFETTTVVGAPGDGLVYVYELNIDTNSWDEIQIIDDIDDGEFDEFGRDVSIYNNSMVILADYTLYFYERLNDSSNKWIEITRFSTNLFFPRSAAISNNYAVFGDDECFSFDITINDGGFGGCMHIYKKNKIFDGNTMTFNWTFLETIQPSDVVAYGHFGEDVDIWDDKYIVSGATGARNTDGNGYVFEINEYDDGSVNITEIAILTPNDTDHSYFGSRVAIFDDTVAISSQSFPSYLYVFERDEVTGNFVEISRTDEFISPVDDVDIYNNYMIAGVDSFNLEDEAFVFHRFHPNQTWGQVAKISDLNDNSAEFGYAVAITQDFAFIGAPDELKNSSSSIRVGAVYIVSDFKPNYLSNPPTTEPSTLPSFEPSTQPTTQPSILPTVMPSSEPTANNQLADNNDNDSQDNDNNIKPLSTVEIAVTPSPTVFIFKDNDNDEVQLILIGVVVLLFVTNIGSCIYFKRREYYDDEDDEEEYDNEYNDEYDEYENDGKDNTTTGGMKQASMGSNPLSRQGSSTLGINMSTSIKIVEEDGGNGNGNGNTTTTDIINPLTGRPYLPRAPVEMALEIDGMPVTGGADINTGNYEYNDAYESETDSNGGGHGNTMGDIDEMDKTAGNTNSGNDSEGNDNDNNNINNNNNNTRGDDESGEDSDGDIANEITTGQ